MVHHMQFDEVATLCGEATKENKRNFYHTWNGWVSKGVLHITSTSGAATRNVWHFGVQQHSGCRMFFKNTTGQAYCYTLPGPENPLEKFVFDVDKQARVEYVRQIDTEMFLYGSGCCHSTDRKQPWYLIHTDGVVEVIQKAGTVSGHMNQGHNGCPTGSDTCRVTGGTYAIQWQRNYGQLCRVVLTEKGKEAVIASIDTERKLREIEHDPYLKEDGHMQIYHDLLAVMANGVALPAGIKEQIIGRAAPYGGAPIEGVDRGLLERARYYHPGEIEHRRVVDGIVSYMRSNLDLYLSEDKRNGVVAILLPKSHGTPDWKRLLGYSGKLQDYSGTNGYWGPDFSPEPKTLVQEWPEWVERSVREHADTYHHQTYKDHVVENMTTAEDLAVVVHKEGLKDTYHSTEHQFVKIINGSDPNTGFQQCQWNRWWESQQ